ncbi:hypothetical protein ACJX0J_012875, partial [Zea mays]
DVIKVKFSIHVQIIVFMIADWLSSMFLSQSYLDLICYYLTKWHCALIFIFMLEYISNHEFVLEVIIIDTDLNCIGDWVVEKGRSHAPVAKNAKFIFKNVMFALLLQKNVHIFEPDLRAGEAVVQVDDKENHQLCLGSLISGLVFSVFKESLTFLNHCKICLFFTQCITITITPLDVWITSGGVGLFYLNPMRFFYVHSWQADACMFYLYNQRPA